MFRLLLHLMYNMYLVLMMILNLFKYIATILGLECKTEIVKTISLCEEKNREIKKKYELSINALKQWEKEERAKIAKKYEDIELKYGGETIDVKARKIKSVEDNCLNDKNVSSLSLYKN